MAKHNKSKQLVKRLIEKDKSQEKGNVTFRMPKELIENFKEACASQGLSANAVTEELFKQFIEDLK